MNRRDAEVAIARSFRRLDEDCLRRLCRKLRNREPVLLEPMLTNERRLFGEPLVEALPEFDRRRFLSKPSRKLLAKMLGIEKTRLTYKTARYPEALSMFVGDCVYRIARKELRRKRMG